MQAFKNFLRIIIDLSKLIYEILIRIFFQIKNLRKKIARRIKLILMKYVSEYAFPTNRTSTSIRSNPFSRGPPPDLKFLLLLSPLSLPLIYLSNHHTLIAHFLNYLALRIPYLIGTPCMLDFHHEIFIYEPMPSSYIYYDLFPARAHLIRIDPASINEFERSR